MSEWNPKDPETATTRYDLADWSVDERADVVAALAQADVTHAWDGDELVIPQEQEEVVEDILDELEAQMDDDDADDTADDNITEYELDQYSEAERKQLCDMLDNLDIGYRWDDTVLLIPIGVEAVVDSCLDSIDSRGVEFTEGK
ncbi:MAG: hypothetical protein D4R44_02655 [Actinobacteria bacterium]|nr:MAG: hypothetical protein D4R44_02655 [Actinomycetota bacterium]